jgi:hypothetical protein
MIAFVVSLVVFFVTVLVMSLAVRPVMRHIDIVVPFVAHEIDWSSASIIFGAVFVPVFLMTGRYVHIERLLYCDAPRRGSNQDGSFVNEFRPRSVPNINAPIKARLANTD